MQNALLSSPISLQLVNGHPVTISIDVADHFHKRHKDVLRAIRNLECSENFRERNFALTSIEIKQPNGGTRPEQAYQITRDGFTFLCMGFTGPEAGKWKEAYIHAFNEMEKALAAPPETINPEQQNALQQIIKRLSGDDGRKLAGLWSRFNNHFKLGSYKQLPTARFAEAVSYLEALAGEQLLPPPVNPLDMNLLEIQRKTHKWFEACSMTQAFSGQSGRHSMRKRFVTESWRKCFKNPG